MVEEDGAPGENYQPWASNWSTLSLAAASRVHPFCNLQSRARTRYDNVTLSPLLLQRRLRIGPIQRNGAN